MMNKRISILSIEHPLERTALQVLFGATIFLLCLYLYFVTASVLNIIARKEASAAAANISTKIAMMEQQYFDLSSAVNPETAPSLGLAPIEGTDYVYRPGTAAINTTDTMSSNAI